MTQIYLTIMMTFMLGFKICSIFLLKHHPNELEHPAFITEWKSNLDEATYKA